MISKKTIDEIMLATKIEEVVGDFIPLKRAGKDWVGLCPFHDDKDPSLHVSPRLGIFKCFVCDSAGNAVHFLMEHEKISYPDALRYLANKYHIDIEEDKKELSPEEQAIQTEREGLLGVNAYAEKFFIEQMNETEDGRNIGLSYFKERGFQEATIKKFKLGYCPDGWDTFTKAALDNGYKLEYLLTTGLTKQSEKGKTYDFYRGRVIFPIHNAAGKTVGFGGRILAKNKSDKVAKYFNSPENPIYHKSDILYGFFFARKAIRTKDNVYLVEGYTDVISMAESGVENVVASSGTALTSGQIRLIASQTKNITVLYDGDNAGIKASLRGINLLLEAGLNVKTVLLPDGEDPDSFAKSHRDSELVDYLEKNATDFIRFKAHILLQGADDPIKKGAVIDEIIETIALVKDEVTQTFYVRECAEMFNVPEELLMTKLRKIVWKKLNTGKSSAGGNGPANAPEAAGPQQQIPEITRPQKIPSSFKPEANTIEAIELNVVKLILKYGMYEIHIESIGQDGNSIFTPTRIDQYIFNEFLSEEIRFHNPLYQAFYDEYAKIAERSQTQEELIHSFVEHENKAIQNLTIPILMDTNPEYSKIWEQRYDVLTRSTDNNIERLNAEVETVINIFKLRLVEEQKTRLHKELEENHPVEIQRAIVQRYIELDQLRKQIADLVRTVITK